MNEQEHETHRSESEESEANNLEGSDVLDHPVEQVVSQFEDTETFPHVYDVGEEVMYDEDRYIISQIDEGRSSPYKLLAGSDRGGRIVWAREKDLERIKKYITAVHDSGQADSW